jgi:hypothetical protein
MAWTALIGQHEENAILVSLQLPSVAPTTSLPLVPVDLRVVLVVLVVLVSLVVLVVLVSLVSLVCPLRVAAVLAVGVEQATTKGETARSLLVAWPTNHWNSMTQECPLFLPLLVWKR